MLIQLPAPVTIILYLILFKIVKRSLERNGKAISQIFSKRYRLNNEGFGGINDLL